MAKNTVKETPLMGQYNAIKAKYPDALLLFRVGDFYETFSSDAVTTSQVLGIVLTRRSNGAASDMELAGFPYHALDTYLPKLVQAGYRVAICDQLEDPKLTKTIVKRGVTELVTPGVTDNDKILDHKSNNFLCVLHADKSGMLGLAFLDISTGEFLTAQGDSEYADKLLQSFQPSEVIFAKSYQKTFKQLFGTKFYTYAIDDWAFQYDYAYDLMLKHFNTGSLKGFGIQELSEGIIACGVALHYLNDTEHPHIKHLTKVSRLQQDKYLWLDRFTIRNLELVYTLQDEGKSLMQTLDLTLCPMGARLLKRWILMPLLDIGLINERLNVVEAFIKDADLALHVSKNIKQVGDLERLISKAATGKINPRDMWQVHRALNAIQALKNYLKEAPTQDLKTISDQLNPCTLIKDKIENELDPDAPVMVNKGHVFKEGIIPELDDLRNISTKGKDYLTQILQREITNTGITSLKISYNSVFGYYLEVTNSHKAKVPTDWIRKQTLTNAERYVTPELKEYEEKILGAEEKITALEQKYFEQLILALQDYIEPIQLNAALIARLDVLHSFSVGALKYNYRRPELNESHALSIVNGRHPVIERQLEPGNPYVPNDIELDRESQQLIIITGPNMAGKSALLRQNALIVLMAQMGSFVPAEKAVLGITDRIFTRVGASDSLSTGESTFMVEMNETASIINNLSDRSLILLDEIGRGTSTFDGISIAWSIAEYLHQHKTRPKTLFATHYHEMNELTDKFERIKNFNVSVREANGKIIFLRRLEPGGSQHSFGIHVARLAGMPPAVVSRANEILKQLESTHLGNDLAAAVKKMPAGNMQLSFFAMDDPTLSEIKRILEHLDINTLTPVEALMKLNEIKKMLGR